MHFCDGYLLHIATLLLCSDICVISPFGEVFSMLSRKLNILRILLYSINVATNVAVEM